MWLKKYSSNRGLISFSQTWSRKMRYTQTPFNVKIQKSHHVALSEATRSCSWQCLHVYDFVRILHVICCILRIYGNEIKIYGICMCLSKITKWPVLQVQLQEQPQLTVTHDSEEDCTSASKRVKLSGKFKRSWKVPYISSSKKGDKFAHCTLCLRDFSVSHGGINDVMRHCQSRGHVNRYSDCQSNSTLSSFVTTTNPSHQSEVIAAEVMMSKFTTYLFKQLII